MSWDRNVFDRIYAEAEDPWQVQTSAYEREKYARTLAALPPGRFANGLEVGCSIGAQTVQLAARCDRLLALDISPEAVRRTRERCRGLAQVEVREAAIPRDWPKGVFDLIVVSEILYFLDRDDLVAAARRAVDSSAPGGVILLVNWTGPTDTPTTGDEAAELFATSCGRAVRLHERHETYRIDMLST
jgi:SAM-dependent methyltransferase